MLLVSKRLAIIPKCGQDDFDIIMQEVAFNAKCGGYLHYSELKLEPWQPSLSFSMSTNVTPISSRINMEKGSVDPAVLALVGNEPTGTRMAFAHPVFGSKWKEACDNEVENLLRKVP